MPAFCPPSWCCPAGVRSSALLPAPLPRRIGCTSSRGCTRQGASSSMGWSCHSSSRQGHKHRGCRNTSSSRGNNDRTAASTARQLGASNIKQQPRGPDQGALLPPTLKICAKFTKLHGAVEGVLDVLSYRNARGSPCVAWQGGGSSDSRFICASLAQHVEKVSRVGSWKNNVYVM